MSDDSITYDLSKVILIVNRNSINIAGMKKLGLVFIILPLFWACDSSGEKKAQSYLIAAENALNSGNFNEAKLQLDSIKILYPKAFNARKESIKLLQQIEYSEQMKTIAYLDSMLQISQKEFESIKGKYVFEKDPEFQDVGNYFYPTQTLERNLNRSFLRGQVNEMGEMYITSIYSGTYHIHHKAVKITAPDGSFAETPISADIYESSDLGIYTEKADYKLGNDGNVIGFLTLHKDDNLKAEYLGGKKYIITVPAQDKKAIAELYTLSQVLTAIEQIKKEMKEANLKIEFLKRKMEEGKDGEGDLTSTPLL